MKFGTKIGWILVAFSIVLSVWVISGIGSKADTTDANGFVTDDTGKTLTGYTGVGGSITIPGTVTSIASNAFVDQEGIISVTMPDTVTSLGTGVFSGCSGMQSITLSGKVTSIPDQTFYECYSLAGVDLSNITYIGNNAFKGVNISDITLPANLGPFATNCFDEVPSLQNITVDASNKQWSSYAGCLYNNNQTILTRCPEGKGSIELAPSCVEIAADAFKNCNMAEVTIPATVTKIREQSDWNPTVIYGYTGSAAETYAMNHGIHFEALGTGDGGGGSGGGSDQSTYYTVTFDVNGGNETISSQSVKSGEYATKPTDPTKTGYSFVGWYNGDTAWDFTSNAVMSNITLTAQWKQNGDGGQTPGDPDKPTPTPGGTTYTVSFNLNGGTGNSTTQTVKAGEKATNPGNPTKKNCTFMGWSYGSSAGDMWNFETYTVNFNVTLTAVWKNANGSIDRGTTTGGTGGSSGNGGHVKDTTPKTADGDLDPRYFLSLSFLLVGVAAILYSKRQKTEMIAERRHR